MPLETNISTRRAISDMAGTEGSMRFILDHNIDSDVMLRFLDGAGLGAHMLPYHLQNASDEDVLEYAFKADRVLLTHDEDFLNQDRFPPERNPGIVILPGGSGDVRNYFDVIGHMLRLMKPYPGLWLQTYVQIAQSGIISVEGVNATSKERIDKWYLRFDKAGNAESWNGDEKSLVSGSYASGVHIFTLTHPPICLHSVNDKGPDSFVIRELTVNRDMERIRAEKLRCTIWF